MGAMPRALLRGTRARSGTWRDRRLRLRRRGRMSVANRVGRSIHPVIGNPYVRLVSGEGVFVTADTGKTYLDAVAGIGVVALGYGRDDLVDALAEQARRLPFAQSM